RCFSNPSHFLEDHTDQLGVVGEPLLVLLGLWPFLPVAAIGEFQRQQFAQQRRLLRRRPVVQIVLDPWLLPCFPGRFKVVTHSVELQLLYQRGLATGPGTFAHITLLGRCCGKGRPVLAPGWPGSFIRAWGLSGTRRLGWPDPDQETRGAFAEGSGLAPAYLPL